jgi:hypothetical protein
MNYKLKAKIQNLVNVLPTSLFYPRADSFSGLIPFLSLFNRLWGKQSKVFLKIFRYLF